MGWVDSILGRGRTKLPLEHYIITENVVTAPATYASITAAVARSDYQAVVDIVDAKLKTRICRQLHNKRLPTARDDQTADFYLSGQVTDDFGQVFSALDDAGVKATLDQNAGYFLDICYDKKTGVLMRVTVAPNTALLLLDRDTQTIAFLAPDATDFQIITPDQAKPPSWCQFMWPSTDYQARFYDAAAHALRGGRHCCSIEEQTAQTERFKAQTGR